VKFIPAPCVKPLGLDLGGAPCIVAMRPDECSTPEQALWVTKIVIKPKPASPRQGSDGLAGRSVDDF
jgi:hypothetical protein